MFSIRTSLNFCCFSPPIFTLPQTLSQILDSSKLTEFADDNFEFHKNSGKFSEKVEITVGKGEITSNFSFSHSVLKKTCTVNKACLEKGSYLILNVTLTLDLSVKMFEMAHLSMMKNNCAKSY